MDTNRIVWNVVLTERILQIAIVLKVLMKKVTVNNAFIVYQINILTKLLRSAFNVILVVKHAMALIKVIALHVSKDLI